MYKLGIVLILTLAVSCCDRKKEAPSVHRDDVAIQSTLYTDQTEFFIEYDPLRAGRESGFLVHVTRLHSYAPLTSGTLTIEIGGEKVTTAGPDRPGIFDVPFTPSVAGNYTVTYRVQSGELSDQVSAPVVVFSDEKSNGHGETMSQVEAGNGEISFLKEQAWNSDFMVEKIMPASFSAVISASGETMAVPGEKKHITAGSSGTLLFGKNNLVQGSAVVNGERLFVISALALDENNFELQYRELRNSLEKSRSEYLRHRTLFENNVISERQFIESRTIYTRDSIRFTNLASGASESGLVVKSPVSGYIHALNFAPGQYVKTGQLIATISANRNLLLRADLPLQYYGDAREITTTNFRTSYSSRIYQLEEMNGAKVATGSSVAENDHFIPVYFEVENDGSLLEGAFVEFFLKTGLKAEALSVPAEAVTEEQGVHYLYIQVTGESFTKRRVKPGMNDGKRTEIIGGLLPGERVVTEGVMLLKAASMVTGDTGHGHAH
ncbi:MAG: efflux RND transporter periplasmic adaptor subunit [Bacteroidales bacterium]